MTDINNQPPPGPLATEEPPVASPSQSDDRGHAHSHGEAGNRGAFLRLALVIVAGAGAAILTNSALTVLVILAVIAMIMIHELGHFITAKWSGMKVTEFFLGFGPTVWSFRKGETEYGVKALPLGGYVRIIGMNNLEQVDPEDEARTYRQKPYWQRFMVGFAGSFMHFVMAFLLLFAAHGILGFQQGSTTIGNVAGTPSEPTPAHLAGLRAGDEIVAINGGRVTEWAEIFRAIRGNPGHQLILSVNRDGRLLDVPLTPAERRASPDAAATGFAGIETRQTSEVEALWPALKRSTTQMGNASVQVVQSLGDLFSPSGLQKYADQIIGATSDGAENAQLSTPSGSSAPAGTAEEAPRFISPLGIGNYANSAADAGIRAVLALLFSINIFVGIFNLIPLPPFDGGHIAVATYEKVRSLRGKRHVADYAKLLPVSYAVFMVLILIGLSALWLDIVNPVADPFQ